MEASLNPIELIEKASKILVSNLRIFASVCFTYFYMAKLNQWTLKSFSSYEEMICKILATLVVIYLLSYALNIFIQYALTKTFRRLALYFWEEFEKTDLNPIVHFLVYLIKFWKLELEIKKMKQEITRDITINASRQAYAAVTLLLALFGYFICYTPWGFIFLILALLFSLMALSTEFCLLYFEKSQKPFDM